MKFIKDLATGLLVGFAVVIVFLAVQQSIIETIELTI